jgi:hypothetical protein
VHAHPLRRQVLHRVIERLDVERDDAAIVGNADAWVERIRHREIETVELKNKPGVDDGAVLALHHVGQRVEIFLVGLVEMVLELAVNKPI